MRSPRLLVVTLLVLICSGSAFAQDSYTKKLNEYLEASGSMPAFRGAIGQMVNAFKQTNNNVPKEFWDEFEKELVSTSLTDVVNMLEPVYKKHLTEADVDAIIAFYKTPAGKKLAAETPNIMRESMLVGQAWGEAVGQQVVDRLKAKGYK